MDAVEEEAATDAGANGWEFEDKLDKSLEEIEGVQVQEGGYIDSLGDEELQIDVKQRSWVDINKSIFQKPWRH